MSFQPCSYSSTIRSLSRASQQDTNLGERGGRHAGTDREVDGSIEEEEAVKLRSSFLDMFIATTDITKHAQNRVRDITVSG